MLNYLTNVSLLTEPTGVFFSPSGTIFYGNLYYPAVIIQITSSREGSVLYA